MKAEDLLTDENFLAWYYQAGWANGELWDEKIKTGPQLQLEVEKAICLLEKIFIKEEVWDNDQTISALKKILSDHRIEK